MCKNVGRYRLKAAEGGALKLYWYFELKVGGVFITVIKML